MDTSLGTQSQHGTDTPFEPGDRVATMQTDGEPAGSIGTITHVRDHENTQYVLVKYDGDSSRWNQEKPVRRTPFDNLQRIGCEECGDTGVTAERREGTTYPLACRECFADGVTLGYLWDAEQFKLTADV